MACSQSAIRCSVAALVHKRVARAGSMSSQSRSAAVSGRLIGALWRDQEVDDPASGVGPPLLEVLVQSGDLVVARRGAQGGAGRVGPGPDLQAHVVSRGS